MRLRPLDPGRDLGRQAEIETACSHEPVTLAQLEEVERARLPAASIHRWVAEEGGRVVGFGLAYRAPWMVEGKWWLNAMVDPVARARGAGRRLLDAAVEAARADGARRLCGQVRDDHPSSLTFVERHGFAVQRHTFESTLDLATFDETPHLGALARAEATGIRFASLADLGETPEARRALYELNRRTSLQAPGSDSFPSFEQFERQVYGASWFSAAGQVLALDGDRFVGLGAVGQAAEKPEAAFNAFTGVDDAYRGRGIATALKLLGIRHARRLGAAYVWTNNDSTNAPMLAINRKLGYRPRPGYFQVERRM